jgi:hypothetical protein
MKASKNIFYGVLLTDFIIKLWLKKNKSLISAQSYLLKSVSLLVFVSTRLTIDERCDMLRRAYSKFKRFTNSRHLELLFVEKLSFFIALKSAKNQYYCNTVVLVLCFLKPTAFAVLIK